MKRVKAGFIAPVGKGVRQEIGGKHGGKSKGKGIMHKGLGFQPVSRDFSEDFYWCWRIGHKEAQCLLEQEYTKSNPPQDPLKRQFVNGRTQRRKGKVTASPKVKAKVMERARDDIQQKKP